MGSTFGELFRVTTFGESHGPAVGCVIDGCPPQLPISAEEIQRELDRRRPGQSRIVTQRQEADQVEVLSGVLDGETLGTPIALLVRNKDQRSRDYDEMREKYRPSHADYAYDQKYGIRAWSGGGRASARETVGRVAAGAVAKKLLATHWGVEVVAWVATVQRVTATVDPLSVTQEEVEAHVTRCPDPAAADEMLALIEAVRKEGDSVGGVVGCVARGVPPGWGEPVFDKMEADLAKALLSLPASKGFEIGSGFAGTLLRGSEHNDPYQADPDRRVSLSSNRSGGVQGGITVGEPITLRAAFKPVATVLAEQSTVTTRHEPTTLKGRGRHDPCVLPRAVPMVEAMVALVLADHALRHAAVRSTVEPWEPGTPVPRTGC
ncbi:MAG: chorismate synthase [Fimbriimonadaceae bacterium]|nr:chorismate synthase [Fimbriimonadaceae bacterium]